MQDFLETDSGRYFINTSDSVIARGDLTWERIFQAIDETEELWRDWLFEGFTSPFNEMSGHVMSGIQENFSAKDSNDFTFRMFSSYGKQVKFRYIRSTFIFFAWMKKNEFYSVENRIRPV